MSAPGDYAPRGGGIRPEPKRRRAVVARTAAAPATKARRGRPTADRRVKTS